VLGITAKSKHPHNNGDYYLFQSILLEE